MEFSLCLLRIDTLEDGFRNAYRQIGPPAIPPFLIAKDQYALLIDESASDCFRIDAPLLCHLLNRVMRLRGVPRIGGELSRTCIRVVIRAHMATVP